MLLGPLVDSTQWAIRTTKFSRHRSLKPAIPQGGTYSAESFYIHVHICAKRSTQKHSGQRCASGQNSATNPDSDQRGTEVNVRHSHRTEECVAYNQVLLPLSFNLHGLNIEKKPNTGF